MIIAAVTGGRDYRDAACVDREMARYHEQLEFGVVIHGNAGGLDTLVDNWCVKHGVQPARCPALWDYWRTMGSLRSAGPRRNWAMTLLRPRVLLAWPGGDGTAEMVRRCRALGIEVIQCGEGA